METLHSADRSYDLHLGFGAEHSEDRLHGLRERGIETVCFKSLQHWNLIAAPIAVMTITRYLRSKDIDILHTHSTEAGIVGRWAGALAGTPVVIHEIHGVPVTDDRSILLNTFIKTLERLSAPLTTIFVVKSKHIQENFLDWGIGKVEQYHLIYHGVQTTKFTDAIPTNQPEKIADVRLLFVGRLVEGKGLFDLLSAFESIESQQSVELIIVGDGPLKEDLSDTIQAAELRESVRLTGYREDIAELMSSADCLVLPSYREGTPRVVTEALASGLPVIATDIAGLPEQIDDGETGYLINPGDVDALANKLERIVESPDRRRKMGNTAQDRIEKFNIDVVRQSQQVLYDRLINENLKE